MFFLAVSLRRHRITLFCSLRFPPRDLSAKTNLSIGRDARVRNAWNTRRSDRRKRKTPLSSFSRFLSRLSLRLLTVVVTSRGQREVREQSPTLAADAWPTKVQAASLREPVSLFLSFRRACRMSAPVREVTGLSSSADSYSLVTSCTVCTFTSSPAAPGHTPARRSSLAGRRRHPSLPPCCQRGGRRSCRRSQRGSGCPSAPSGRFAGTRRRP